MTSLLQSPILVRLLSKFTDSSKRRPRTSLRTTLENLESRALLSAVGGESLCIASDVQTVDDPKHGKAAVPKIDGVAGTFDVSGGDIGTGSLTIIQTGQHIDGVFDTQSLISGTFSADFRTAKARTAKGTAVLQFNGDDVASTYKFTIHYKKNLDFTYRYR
ncbi:MAG: hypothetical protein JWN70_4195 [Planctomycetaceae bacterium]|nr:hypothetical protein [Planctomycetaceae bacterium]